MPESTLNLSLTDLEAEVGYFLGFGRGANFGETAWSTRKQYDITECVKSGLRMFYFPSPLPGESASYDWSFLRPTTSRTLVTDESTLDLPDDFGGIEGKPRLISSTRRPVEIDLTNEEWVAREHANLPDVTGQPRICAVRSNVATSQTKGNRWQLYFYPTADDDYTVEFQYYLLPDSLSVSFPYPHGGAVHAETMKAACRAAAELYKDHQPGPMAAQFRDRLAASVSLDRRNKAQTWGYNSDPGYNRGRPYNRHWREQDPITFDGVTPD